MQEKGNKYGTHRVLEPKGVLPQPAKRVDNNMDKIYFCGGSCVEDVTTHLMSHLSLHPTLRTCS